MKRNLLLLLLTVSAIFMSGCTKETRNLDGTVWSDILPDMTITLTFTKNQCELMFASSATAPDDRTVTRDYYSYEYDQAEDTVMMHPERSDKAILKGIISGNTMSVINTSNEQTIGFLKKQ